MTWWTATSVSVTNGSKVVSVNAGDDIALINKGDALLLAGQIMEIDRAYLDGGSAKKILLVSEWSAGNQTAQPARVAPIPAADLRRATEALRAVGMDAVTFSEALAEIITSTADTITISTETAGDITVVPYGKITTNQSTSPNANTLVKRTATGTIKAAAAVAADEAVVRAQLGTAAYRDLLGTVSQSGGVPTGAIFQRGSNANGSFVRFADGTMISWGELEKSVLVSPTNLNVVVQGITIYRSGNPDVIFPITSITTPTLSFTPVSSSLGSLSPQPIWGKISAITGISCSLQLHGLYGWQNDGIDYERLQKVQFVAIGRWFN